MTLNEARTILTRELNTVYDRDELRNIIELVLEHITGLSRVEQVKGKIPYLTCTQLEMLDAITERLKKNEPVQYVLGEAWFAGMKFKVNRNVLVPRPETEELVQWVVDEVNAQHSMHNSQFSIIDIGTGSGCIPIAIKKKLPTADLTGIDVCSEALYTAAANAMEQNSEVNFILLDFLDEEKWSTVGLFDIVVSNPPYVKQSEKDSMHARVTSFEPHLALFVPGDDALLFYRKLADFAVQHLHPGGKLFVGINEALGNEVVNVFRSAGLAGTQLKQDMQGKDRLIMAMK